jgi:REP-associated tyrosine transposase
VGAWQLLRRERRAVGAKIAYLAPMRAELGRIRVGIAPARSARMARPLRIQQPGLTYHVWARGNARMPIFLETADRHNFLAVLAAVVARFHIDCHALCQMTNHYHAVITTRDANLSRAMQSLHGEYAEWFNARRNRVGHLFGSRFGAQVIQDGVYFLTACRYVALNPVRAGMVKAPEHWPWSSYLATVGRCRAIPRWLTVGRILGQFDDDRASAMACYERFVTSDRPSRVPRDVVLGDRAFARRFRAEARAASTEVPWRERHCDRLELRDLFDGVLTRADRNAAILRAYDLGWPLIEVAQVLDLHYSTISKIARRCQTVKKGKIQDLTPPAVGAGRYFT